MPGVWLWLCAFESQLCPSPTAESVFQFNIPISEEQGLYHVFVSPIQGRFSSLECKSPGSSGHSAWYAVDARWYLPVLETWVLWLTDSHAASQKNPDTYFFSFLKTISADFLGNSTSPWKPRSQVTARIQSGATIFRLYVLAARQGLLAAPARCVCWHIPNHGLVSSPSQPVLFGSVYWPLTGFI